MRCSVISIVHLEQVNASWVTLCQHSTKRHPYNSKPKLPIRSTSHKVALATHLTLDQGTTKSAGG